MCRANGSDRRGDRVREGAGRALDRQKPDAQMFIQRSTARSRRALSRDRIDSDLAGASAAAGSTVAIC